MLESLRRSIGLQFARFHFRRFPETVISFTDAISEAHDALLIMPLGNMQLLPTVIVIDVLKKRFREENITIVTGDGGHEVMRLLPHSPVVRILPTEITSFFLPRKDLVQRVNRRTYDVAIDLNLDLLLPSAYICKESRARVRVGFAGKQADTFYNLQIKQDPALSKQLVFDRLAKCLEMF